VCSLFAGVKGYLDKVDTENLYKFETGYLAHLRSKYPHILESIRKQKKILPEVEAELRTVIVDYLPNSGVMKA
jgi:F0F1-type ATP synthase alpha subunit